ncbi:hypothetical protein MMC12_004718 [Toensbergia leucococca]|nr:hypothetical protein [Toensbergia leucococca]
MRGTEHFSAVQTFTRVFNVGNTRATPIPVFLAPSATNPFSFISLSRHRRYASIFIEQLTSSQPEDGSTAVENKDAQTLHPRRDPEAWVLLLEPYLPLGLRSKGRDEKLLSFEGVQSIHTLYQLLSKARKTQRLNLDLLTHLGVHQGRWRAVIWLIKAMLSQDSRQKSAQLCLETLHTDLWPTSRSLDELTKGAMQTNDYIEPSGKSFPGLDRLTKPEGQAETASDFASIYTKHNSLRQIWQSAGSMILEAADRPPEDAELIMFHVREIIAELHHTNSVPYTIYNYAPAKDPSVLRRPPTLHLLSSRILIALSDAVWRAQEQEVIAEAESVGEMYYYKGHELPRATYRLWIRGLGTEVWLELVLWCCIEGGWINEAAWIITEMEKRSGDQAWSLISWDAIQEPSTSNQLETARVDWERVKDRTGGAVGSIEGYSADPPFVEMGPRTISSEVIAALIDALVDTIRSTPDTRENTPALAQRYIDVCKKLLERKNHGLESNSWNSIVLRMVESNAFNPEVEPEVMERTLHLAPTYRKETEVPNSPSAPGSAAQGHVAYQSAASLGLLHRTLQIYSRQGNVQGALRTFRKLQDLVDTNRNKSIQEFAGGIEHYEDHDGSRLTAHDTRIDISGFYSQIPVGTLAAFLDLLTDAKLFEIAHRLIYGDGTVNPPKLYSSPNLQAPLLRFASATVDANMLATVTRSLQSPLSEENLRALLHCQIALGKWNSVKDILLLLKTKQGMTWRESDVMVAAKAILLLERKDAADAQVSKSLFQARKILRSLLNGEYTVVRDPSEPRDMSQIRTLNQISRILMTIPGHLATIASDFVSDTGQAHATTSIAVDAFNILLEGVVDSRGSLMGKQMWETWCQSPKSDESNITLQAKPHSDGPEIVVEPNLQTIRTIMYPIANKKRDDGHIEDRGGTVSHVSSQSNANSEGQGLESNDSSNIHEAKNTDDNSPQSAEVGLLEWGVAMYRKFGLADKEINMEVPAYFPKRRRKKWRRDSMSP